MAQMASGWVKVAAVAATGILAGWGAQTAARSAFFDGAPGVSTECISQAAEFDAFPLVYLGEEFEGMPLISCGQREAIIARDGSQHGPTFWLLYGDCPPRRKGCVSSLRIQVVSPCGRQERVTGELGANISPQPRGALRTPGIGIAGSGDGHDRSRMEQAISGLRGANAWAADVRPGDLAALPGVNCGDRRYSR
jgi:hypothetical protein